MKIEPLIRNTNYETMFEPLIILWKFTTNLKDHDMECHSWVLLLVVCLQYANPSCSVQVKNTIIICCESGMIYSGSGYDSLEFRIRILPIYLSLFRNFRNNNNQSKRRIHQLSVLFYFTLKKIILKHC